MFLILGRWADGSEMIFLSGKDPNNPKMPAWSEVFEKLDRYSDPGEAEIQYARISRHFTLTRDEELGFTFDDPFTDSKLKRLKLTEDMPMHWYELLAESGKQAREEDVEDEDIEDLDDEGGNEKS